MVATTISLSFLQSEVKIIVEGCAAKILNQGARILIVDDYGGVRQFLGEALQSRGYRVRLASNGREALAMFVETPADVVITDYEMPPFFNGISLMKMVKALRPDTVTLLLTGQLESRPELIAEAAAAGAHEVIQKPCDLSLVVKRVEEIFREGRSRDHPPPA